MKSPENSITQYNEPIEAHNDNAESVSDSEHVPDNVSSPHIDHDQHRISDERIAQITQPSSEEFTQRRTKNLEEPPPEFWGPQAESLWSEMSDSGKAVANWMYENVYRSPVGDHVTTRLSILYNKHWIHEREADELRAKSRYDKHNDKINELANAKEQLSQSLENLNETQATSIKSEIAKLEQKIYTSEGKRDRAQTTLEKVQGKTEQYRNKRDAATNKLIDRYSEKAAPFEAKMKMVRQEEADLDFQAAVMEASWESKQKELDTLRETRIMVETGLKKSGKFDFQIGHNKTIKSLDAAIQQGQREITREKEMLSIEKARINNNLTELQHKANRYLDKRDHFIRIRDQKPLDTAVPERNRDKNVGESFGTTSTTQTLANIPNYAAESEATHAETIPSIENSIKAWNQFLEQRSPEHRSPYVIDLKKFQTEIKARLNPQSEISEKAFQQILLKYYEKKRMSVKDLKKTFEAFTKSKEKV